ncbi:hypothetical protein [Peterkaempfera bronchialis]|uniref:hypothetical protein n=1 Tax=Peterkaempfera bronchialis TaxID=2126346 RepID=UPI003C2DC5EA
MYDGEDHDENGLTFGQADDEQRRRAEKYAECTAQLSAAPDPAGAESLFDTGFTNGLVAIVVHEWPGQEHDARGRTLPASALLKLIEQKAADGVLAEAADAPGTYVIPEPNPVSFSWMEDGEEISLDTRIDVATLRDGLEATQHIRHARAGSSTRWLEERHIEALVALDYRQALHALSNEEENRDWERVRAEDRHSVEQAVDHLALIGDDEADRRAEAARRLHTGYHPKENPDGVELSDCPVCWRQAFSATCEDELAMGQGPGQCFACGYERSPSMSYHLATIEHFKVRWGDY